MEKIITLDNLRSFAYCNHEICKRPIKGILYLVPYQNPWAWMNRQNVDFTT